MRTGDLVDAHLGTIASDRRLAIVDSRIVQPGDEVRGASVIDMTPTQVLLRQGRAVAKVDGERGTR